MKQTVLLFKVILIQCLVVLSTARTVDMMTKEGYDFFYFVQMWPEAYCDSRHGCCFPNTGKPDVDFTIHGLWPNFNDSSFPEFCNDNAIFDTSKVEDLMPRMQKHWPTLACPSGDGIKFWSHEWEKHGTCSLNVLNQHSYFQKCLEFKDASNILHHLLAAGVKPDDGLHSLASIIGAIKTGMGFTPYVQCNTDTQGKQQLFQIYLCVDKFASGFIECPIVPRKSTCDPEVQFHSPSSFMFFEDYVDVEVKDEL